MKARHSIQSGNLNPEHLADLRKSGLNDTTIRMMDVHSLSVDDLAQRLGWKPSGVQTAMGIPYPNLPQFSRYKLFPAFRDEKGHAVKYLQPKDSGTHLYTLSHVSKALQDPSVPLALTEGEKKAAALVQAGVMAVGIGGLWSWVQSGTQEGSQELGAIAWVDRRVTLYPDSDVWHRPDLLNAVYALVKDLEERGAQVCVALIKPKGAEKTGVDDLLMKGGVKTLRGLQVIGSDHKAFGKANRWWKVWKAKSVLSTPATPTADLPALIEDIRRIPPQLAAIFQRKKRIATVVADYLGQVGTLYRTEEGRAYFFDSSSRMLVALNDEQFRRKLSDLTGLNPSEMEFTYVLEHLLTETHERGCKTSVYSLAHYDAVAHRLFVTDFGGGMWVLDGQAVRSAPNGEEGMLFLASKHAASYAYRLPAERRSGASLVGFLKTIPFDPSAGVSPEEMRCLLRIWLLAAFFPELHPTRPILAIVGPQGATKTSTARRLGVLLLGKGFNVGRLEGGDRGEQAFIAAVCNKPFCAFDNADAPINWLPEQLATFATGQHFELRKLYTTNELVIYRPLSQLILTSRDPYFRRPDVAERLLLCRVSRPDQFVEEGRLLAEMVAQRDDIMSDLLDSLNQALAAMRQVPKAPAHRFRMADFAGFAWRLSQAQGGAEGAAAILRSLGRLEEDQAKYATEEDSVADCLAVWVEKADNSGREIETAKLFKELGLIAFHQGLILPKTSAALGKHLRLSRQALESALGIRIKVHRTSHTSRWVFTKIGGSTSFPKVRIPHILRRQETGFKESGQDGQAGGIPRNPLDKKPRASSGKKPQKGGN